MHTMKYTKSIITFRNTYGNFLSSDQAGIFFKNPYQNVNVKYLTYSLYSIYDAFPTPIHFVNRITNTWTEISSPMVTTFIITFTGRFVAE